MTTVEPILLNIGNTRVQRRDFPCADIVSCPTSEFCAETLPDGAEIVAASVVPALRAPLEQRHAIFISHGTASNLLDFSHVDASTLGADRIANAAALATGGPLPAVCLDAGTAVTLEIVAPGKIFLGGAILPGRKMLRRALHAGTAQLPEISLFPDLPAFPAVCTADSLRWGTDGLLLEGVRAMLERVCALFSGQNVRFVACGGDASFFCKHIPFLEQTSSGFTLDGIRSIYRSFHHES